MPLCLLSTVTFANTNVLVDFFSKVDSNSIGLVYQFLFQEFRVVHTKYLHAQDLRTALLIYACAQPLTSTSGRPGASREEKLCWVQVLDGGQARASTRPREVGKERWMRKTSTCAT